MKKNDLLFVSISIALLFVLYAPIFYMHYVYTDEAVQLWNYKKGSGFNMFIPQGRWLTNVLFEKLFGAISTIRQITSLRLFSFFGWLVCLPAWYFMLKDILRKEALPELMAFFMVLYLITCPPFSVSVQWASCMELFLANTCGLASGYILYKGIRYKDGLLHVPTSFLLLSFLLGLVSLFSYQNGFGCFFIPLLLHLLHHKKFTRTLKVMLIFFFCILITYFLLFRYSLNYFQIGASTRTQTTIDPWTKLAFFFTRPLTSAFHYCFIIEEGNRTGIVISLALFVAWALLTFFKRLALPKKQRIIVIAAIVCFLILVYLPSLIVHENYASNRTLLAIDLTVFLLTADLIFYLLRSPRQRYLAVAACGVFFVCCGLYNYRHLFLHPVIEEYQALRRQVESGYTPQTKTVYFIRPRGELFADKFRIAKSWDEFGVPSSFFEWVPEYFVKQTVYEKTGNRDVAQKITVKSLAATDSLPVIPAADSVLVIRADQVLK